MKLLKKRTVFEDDNGRQYSLGNNCKELVYVIEFLDRIIVRPYFFDKNKEKYKEVFCFSKADGHLMWRSQPPYELNEPYFDGDETVQNITLYKVDEEKGQNLLCHSSMTDGRMDRQNNWMTLKKYRKLTTEHHISDNQGNLIPSELQLKLSLTKQEEDSLLIDGCTGPLWYGKLDETFDKDIHFIKCSINSYVVAAYKIDIDTGKLVKMQKGID